MKKLIFILIAIVISVAAYAQKPAVKPMPWNPYLRVMPQPDSAFQKPIKPNHSNPKTDLSTLVGTSGSLNNNFISQHHQMSYSSDFNVLSYIHCGGSTFGTVNQIVSNYSIDGGITWNSTTFPNCIIASSMVYNSQTYLPRFPSGALYNPSGNTNINNLYTVVAGPAVFSSKENVPSSSQSFQGTYIAWKKHDLAAVAKYYLIPHGDIHRADYNSFQICDNGKFYFNGYAHYDNQATSWHHTLVSGTLNATTDQVENVTTTNFTSTNLPFYKPTVSSPGLADYSAAVAFNKSGTVGYYVFIGVRSDIPDPTYRTSYRPIVYKTIDGGTNWVLQPDFDFDRLPAINENIQGIWQDEFDIRPNFNHIEDLVVDGNDNLHILSFIYGQYTSNSDSIGYVWPYENIKGLMFDTYFSSKGWDATLIATENAKDYSTLEGSFLQNTSRLQGMVSSDGNIIFYSWADTEDPYDDNRLPNIYLNGRHVDSANVINATAINLTSEDDNNMGYVSTFHAMTPIVQKDGDDLDVRLITTKVGEFESSPVSFYYLSNVQDYNTYSVIPPITILNQSPSNFNIIVDSNALLSVTIDTIGNAPTYQWQYLNGSLWDDVKDGFPQGAHYDNPTTNKLNVEGIDVVGTYEYRCFISIRKGLRTGFSETSTVNVYDIQNDSTSSIRTIIYPNPATNNLTIELQGNTSEMGFVVLNSLGQTIYRGNMLEKSTIETSNFTQGVYLIKFDNGKLFKFIKSEVK